MKTYTSKNYAKHCFLNNERTLESGLILFYPLFKNGTCTCVLIGINRGLNNAKKLFLSMSVLMEIVQIVAVFRRKTVRKT